MRQRMNSSMAALLQSQEVTALLASTELAPGLRELAESDFVDMRGCTFLKALRPEGFNVARRLSLSVDRTELEVDVNTIYTPSYFNHEEVTPTVLLLVHGLIYAREIARRLDTRGRFRVICSYHGGELFLPDCDVRFHRARRGHDWLRPDLEEYRLNSILVFDTGVAETPLRT
jgi:hypothetical protein